MISKGPIHDGPGCCYCIGMLLHLYVRHQIHSAVTQVDLGRNHMFTEKSSPIVVGVLT